MDVTNMKQNLVRTAPMLFVTMLTAWLWVAPAEVQAQTRDVITFTGGAPDPDNPDIYVIDAGDVPVDEGTWLLLPSR